MKKKVGLVVLAAGSSLRYQGIKLLDEIDGKKMYRYILDTLKDTKMEPKVMVTQYEEIAQEAEKEGFCVVMNHKPEEGISRSIRLGMEKILEGYPEIEGMMFSVSDQPYIKKETIQKIVQAFCDDKGQIVSAAYEEISGNPCIFNKSYFKELLCLEGDRGGKCVIKNHGGDVFYLQINNKKELQDIDIKNV
ncbi:MAG: nucleotidyltransferase family protein [Acetivibrio sp.]